MTSLLSPGDPRPDGPAITLRAVAAYFAIALVMFVPAFLPEQQIAGSDYVTGGYYFMEFITQRLHAGHLPKWVPYIFGGLPLYSNPGSTYYPVRLLLSVILPLERVLPALFVVQFAMAGIGMHLFARVLGTRRWVAFLAGLMFQMTGVIFSYVYAGHDGRIIVSTLSPLVFYFVTRAVVEDRTIWFVGLSATVGMMLLSFQLQNTYYALLAGGVWALFILARERRTLTGAQLGLRAGKGLVAVAFAFVLAAVNLLPFSGYVKDSPRSAAAKRDFAFSTQFSMPLEETIGFAVPEQAGILEEYRGENPFKLHTEYVGAVVLLLLAVGVVVARREAAWRVLAGLAAFMLSICYGSYTPLYALYYVVLPGTPKFRSPSIALFLVSLSLVAMGAITLELVARAAERRESDPALRPVARRSMRITTAVLALAVVAIVISLGTVMDGGAHALGWLRFAVCMVLAALVLRAWLTGKVRVRTATVLLGVLIAADLTAIDYNFLWTQPPPEVVYAADPVVRFLQTHEPGRVWVFPFPETPGAVHYEGNGRFGPRSDYLMRFGITQAGGEHGNQLYRYNRLAGIAKDGGLDWHNFVNYPQIMNAASIRYIVSGVPLKSLDSGRTPGIPGLKEVFKGQAYVYENVNAVPRAYLAGAVRAEPTTEAVVADMRRGDWNPLQLALVEGTTSPLPEPVTGAATQPSPGDVQLSAEDPDRVALRVHANRRAMLVLTDNYADGWVARVDGQETPVHLTNETFRGVVVEPGTHDVVFSFEPRSLYAGLWITIGAWSLLIISCGGIALAGRRMPRRAPAPRTAYA